MSLSNRELQQRKTCQLYTYVLESLGKEVPFHIEECADYQETDEYDCLLDCSRDLSKEIQNLSEENYEKLLNNKESENAKKLTQWWEMYKLYIPIDQFEKK